jgi:hypothetical protein
MNIHGIFPTLLLEDEETNHNSIKSSYMRTLMTCLSPEGFSHERTGHVTLHHDRVFEPICIMATRLAQQYCEVMQVDPDLFDFNIVKTWFNILRNNSTPFHSHADAHLSFCYYINVPKDVDQKIRFYGNEAARNDPFPGFIKFNTPFEWNGFNSFSWSFDAVEGRMYVFNAKICHDTTGQPTVADIGVKSIEDAYARRITFAGDIILTYKEKEAKTMGIQPKRNWRTFDAGQQ